MNAALYATSLRPYSESPLGGKTFIMFLSIFPEFRKLVMDYVCFHMNFGECAFFINLNSLV